MSITLQQLAETTEDPREALLLYIAAHSPVTLEDAVHCYHGEVKRVRKYLADLMHEGCIVKNQSGAWVFLGWRRLPRRKFRNFRQSAIPFPDDLADAMGTSARSPGALVPVLGAPVPKIRALVPAHTVLVPSESSEVSSLRLSFEKTESETKDSDRAREGTSALNRLEKIWVELQRTDTEGALPRFRQTWRALLEADAEYVAGLVRVCRARVADAQQRENRLAPLRCPLTWMAGVARREGRWPKFNAPND